MESTPQRVLTRCLLRPADVRPQFEGFEVIGTFNPAAIEFGDEIALLVRVAERSTETREGYIALPYWDWRRCEVAIDWRRSDEVEVIDPRIVRLRRSGHLRLTFVSWLLVAFTSASMSSGSALVKPAPRRDDDLGKVACFPGVSQ